MESFKLNNPFALVYDDYRAEICKLKYDMMIVIGKKKTAESEALYKNLHQDLIDKLASEQGLLEMDANEIIKVFFQSGCTFDDLINLQNI